MNQLGAPLVAGSTGNVSIDLAAADRTGTFGSWCVDAHGVTIRGRKP